MDTLKNQLFRLCNLAVDQKMTDCKTAIALARESSMEETKSSAGDKYETARAMIQQEIDKYSLQLQDAEKQKALLNALPNTEVSIVSNGSLVITNHGNFFIAVSIGQLSVDNTNYFAISSASPIGAILLNKQSGDTFHFREKEYIIKKVY